jgi:general secretion pathway protein A
MSETFYGGFYGFETPPFHITPDPTLLFPTETHRAALGAIEYGIAAGKGFMVITGEVGVGKTTVLKVCLDGLDASKTKVIYLYSPALTTPELYATILDEFDVTLPPTSNQADALRVLQKTLFAVHESGIQVILAVDEAQQMPEGTLESLRILSNLETHKSKLLQIILVGQPELEALLAKHSLRQLAQRVAVRARIKSLTFRQSFRYVAHRTRCAGRIMSRPLFTTPALCYIALVSHGIPRTINICCDNALINGYGHAAERIKLSIVREACKSMKFGAVMRRSLALGLAAVLLVGVVVATTPMLRRFLTPHPSGGEVAAAPASAVSPAPEPAPEPASAATPQPAESPPPESAALSAASEPRPAPTRLSSTVDTIEAFQRKEHPGSAPASPASGTAAPSATASPSSQATARTAPPEAPGAPQAPSSLRPDSSGSSPSAPIPWIPAEDAPKTTEAAKAGEHNRTTARRPARKQLKWFVHDGDTVYKACRATYGFCDQQTLRAVFAYNPQINPSARIHEGQVLLMPALQSLARSN